MIDTNKRLATLSALLDFQDAVARHDLKAAMECREKRLVLALGLFSADRKRLSALQHLFHVSGRRGRGIDSANTLREALERAFPLFKD